MTLAEILTQLGVEFKQSGEHHHTSHGRLQVDCPWCSPRSGRFRMGLRLGGSVSCWSCGFHGLVASLVEITGTPWQEVKALLADVEGADDFPVHDIKRRGKLALPDGVGTMLLAHRRYLIKRGFDPYKVEKLWGIQGIGPAPKLSWRLFLPVTLDGEIVSWTTRSIADNPRLRYVTAKPEQEAISCKDLLFGEDHCRHSVVVHEGPLDAMAVGPGAVAVLGLTYTKAQVLRIAKYPRRAVCFDTEPDAQRRARALCDELECFPGNTVNVLLETGKDAAECSKKEIRKLRRRFLDD